MLTTEKLPKALQDLAATTRVGRHDRSPLQIANEAPLPLMREMPDPEPFPMDALGSLIGSAGKRIHQIVQAPDAVCGQSLLAACTLAVQAHAEVAIDGRQYPLSGYFTTISESGERKSGVDTIALRSMREFESELKEQREEKIEEYEDRSAIYESERKKALNLKSREEVEAGLRNLGDRPREPVNYIMLFDDPSFEGIAKYFENGLPTVGLFSDEGGKFIGGYSMSEEKQLGTAAGLSSLWDGRPVTRVRSGDGSSKLFGRRLSVHIMLQPVVAAQLFSNAVLGGQGFFARFLVCYPKSTAGSRPYQEVDLGSDESLNWYYNQMARTLRVPLPIKEGKLNELEPRLLPVQGAAKQKWIVFYNTVEKHLADSGEFASIRAFGSKAPEHALRMAGVLTLIENIEAGEVSPNALDAAITLTRFYLGEALRLSGSSGVDPNLIAAQKLLNWFHERDFDVVDLPTIYQRGPNSIREKSAALRAVRTLEDHRWLTRIDGGMEIDGKMRREAWRVAR